jgi:hypothetical protein
VRSFQCYTAQLEEVAASKDATLAKFVLFEA